MLSQEIVDIIDKYVLPQRREDFILAATWCNRFSVDIHDNIDTLTQNFDILSTKEIEWQLESILIDLMDEKISDLGVILNPMFTDLIGHYHIASTLHSLVYHNDPTSILAELSEETTHRDAIVTLIVSESGLPDNVVDAAIDDIDGDSYEGLIDILSHRESTLSANNEALTTEKEKLRVEAIRSDVYSFSRQYMTPQVRDFIEMGGRLGQSFETYLNMFILIDIEDQTPTEIAVNYVFALKSSGTSLVENDPSAHLSGLIGVPSRLAAMTKQIYKLNGVFNA